MSSTTEETGNQKTFNDNNKKDKENNNQNVKESDDGAKILEKLRKANKELSELVISIQTSIETLIQKVNLSNTLSETNKTDFTNALLAEGKKVDEALAKVKESKIKEETLNKQLESISAEVNKLEKNITNLLGANEAQQKEIDKIGKMDGGYQYKNPRSKRKLNKNNRFGVLKTKSKSKSKKGKKKRKLGKGKKSMRGGMKKRTKSKRKSKNSKKTRKRRKKNKRK